MSPLQAIICNVTPAACHQEESHSTLRFACRAKRVVNNAVVNEVGGGGICVFMKLPVVPAAARPEALVARSTVLQLRPLLPGAVCGGPPACVVGLPHRPCSLDHRLNG